ncbi:MAG: metallophosphoesterase [Candidatus Diapherotrites archaeon]
MKEKQISKSLRILGLSLFFPREKTLIISDIHLGFEEMLNKQGVFVPRTNFSNAKKRLLQVFSALESEGNSLESIVVNGDLKHEFGSISEQEWAEVLDFLSFLQMHCKKIILIKGNHDNILGPIAKWKGIEILEELFFSKQKILVLHGDKIPKTKAFSLAKTLVIGHEHPSITLREGVKAEQFKCFLKGKFNGKQLIVLPSFSEMAYGSSLLREKPLSPFLQGGLSDFEVWAVEDKPYYVGKLNNLV